MSFAPFKARQRCWAAIVSLKTIVRHAIRLPEPFVFRVRSRTVAKVDSIEFVVRRCTQCSAGKSWNVRSTSRSFFRHSTAFGCLA
jgi:hypothetical protein